ncbi:MAG: Pentapeptide repeat family protein [Planctomycetaceae bacterium]|nr:Pentapeptide repeat family protein [Planctomycetaceae bacterium]
MAGKEKNWLKKDKLKGKRFVFAGKFGGGGRGLSEMVAFVGSQGGTVLEDDKVAPDYLVVGAGIGGKPPAAVAKIQKRHPNVQLIEESGFYILIAIDSEELVSLIESGPHGYLYWNTVRWMLSKPEVPLTIRDIVFRRCTMDGFYHNVEFDNCDFRNVTFQEVGLHGAKHSIFDGTTMEQGAFTNAEDCRLLNVTMNKTHWNPGVFARCDFTGSKLNIDFGGYTRATDCSFQKVDLNGARLASSVFQSVDFRGANLSDSNLTQCEFTGAQLNDADLSRCDLRGARFVNADLTRTKFHDSLLSGATLSQCVMNATDFSGANLTDAETSGVDLSLAKNAMRRQLPSIGPGMQELAEIANRSEKFKASVDLGFEDGNSVTLVMGVELRRDNRFVWAQYWRNTFNFNWDHHVEAPTFEQGMLNLANMWWRGKPIIRTLTFETKKCPVRTPELIKLATVAWSEACGLEAPIS